MTSGETGSPKAQKPSILSCLGVVVSCWGFDFCLVLVWYTQKPLACFFTGFLDRIASDQAFFGRTLAKLQYDPSFWQAIPGTDHTVDIDPIIQLLQKLQPLNEEKRLDQINNAEVDRMLTSWIRHIVARVKLQEGNIAYQTILMPLAWGGAAGGEFRVLSSYFNISFHYIFEGYPAIQDHLYTPSGPIDAVFYVGSESAIAPMPFLDAPSTKAIIVSKNQNHAQVLRRKKTATPFRVTQTLDFTKTLSRGEVLFLLQLPWFVEHLGKDLSLDAESRPTEPFSISFAVSEAILYDFVHMDVDQLVRLERHIQQAPLFDSDPSDNNPRPLLLRLLWEIKNASSREHQIHIARWNIASDIVEDTTRYLAIFYGIEVEIAGKNYHSLHRDQAKNRMEAWKRFVEPIL